MSAQVQCIKRAEGFSIDYTPVSAVTAGDVIVQGSHLVGIASHDIDASALGSLDVEGMWRGPKVASQSQAVGAALYWNASGDPNGGTPGTGAFTTTSSAGPFAGWVVAAAASNDETVDFVLASVPGGTTTLRSALGQDDLAPYAIPLTSMQVTGTGALLGATAGTPSGAMGLTVGTYGTNTPLLVGEAASGNSKTDICRFQFSLPIEYVGGQAITLRIIAKATGTLNTAKTVDASCYVSDNNGGLGSDIVTTNAQAVTTSFANYDFTITPTSRVAGDMLDIQITIVANDTGGSNNKLVEIGAVEILLSVKG